MRPVALALAISVLLGGGLPAGCNLSPNIDLPSHSGGENEYTDPDLGLGPSGRGGMGGDTSGKQGGADPSGETH